MIYKKYLDVAIQAAKVAEKIIKSYYGGALSTEYKNDKSPVTIADKEVEYAIKEIIRNHFPEHGFLGEESGTSETTSEYMWVVDPIDGTKNYTRNIPLFATQIALMHKDEVVVGVSLAPEIDELATSYKGGGAYLNGKQVHVSDVAKVEEAYVSYGGLKYFKKRGLERGILDLTSRAYYSRGIGDAWSYHLLARGAMDVMIEADTKIWDICAVSIIVEEAGGKITDISGSKLSKKTKSIIATNGKIHDEVVSIMANV